MAPINQLIIDHQSVTSVILPSQQDFLLWGGTSFPSSLTRCQLSLRISSFLTLPSIYRAATFVMYPRRALGDVTSVNDVALSSEVCFHSRSPLAVFAFVCCGSGGCYLVNDAAFYRRFVFVLIHRTRSLQMTDLPAPQRKPNAALPAYNWGSSTSSPTVYSMNLLCLDLPPPASILRCSYSTFSYDSKISVTTSTRFQPFPLRFL